MKNQKFGLMVMILVLLSAAGCIGPAGPSGPAGPPGLTEYEVVVDETVVNSSVKKQLRVVCPSGKKALGAGWSVLDSTGAILEGRVTYFQPAFDGSNWLVNAENKSTFSPDWKLRVRVICAKVSN